MYYVFSIKQIHEGTATAQRDESETAANGRPNRTKIVQKNRVLSNRKSN